MSRLLQVLARVVRDLEATHTPFALVGGLAVSAHIEPRFTRDIDLAVDVTDDATAEALVAALASRGYRVTFVAEQEAVDRLATVRLAPPGEEEEGVVIDLLFASSGVETEIVTTARPLVLAPSLTLPVAGRESLIALKVLARDDVRRPQDRQDLAGLVAGLDPIGEARVRQLLQAICDRGFHRGRDLLAEWEALRATP